MDLHDLKFVIPTYRLRDVGNAIEQYDQHFWKNGHTLKLIVFDDSSVANQQKYFELLERTRTHNEVFYVGPREKEQFLAYLNSRLRDALSIFDQRRRQPRGPVRRASQGQTEGQLFAKRWIGPDNTS